MKNFQQVLAYLFLGCLLVLNACKSPVEEEALEPGAASAERRYVRVLVNDASSTKVTLLNPRFGSSTTFNAEHANATIYAGGTRRYGYLFHRIPGVVQILDCGILDHIDHVHSYEPKIMQERINSALPTHFSTSGSLTGIFNDGDGSVTVFDELKLENPGSFNPANIPVGMAHHGAVSPLSNNTYVVTERVAGASGTLPGMVKVIDATGRTLRTSSFTVTGIHGNASNGRWGVLGSTNGAIAAGINGEVKLIPNHTSMNDQSGNWMGTIAGHDKLNHFFGFARNLGIFRIDPAAGTITPLIQADNIFSMHLSTSGETLAVMFRNGTLSLYDAQTGNKIAEKASMFTISTAQGAVNPVVGVTRRYVYITKPDEGKVEMYDRERNLELAYTFTPGGTPRQMVVMGTEF